MIPARRITSRSEKDIEADASGEEEVENQDNQPPSTELTTTKGSDITDEIGSTKDSGLKSTPIPSKVVLPTKVSLEYVTKDNIDFFRRLISIILPVSYSDSFYTSILTDPSTSDLTLLAYWSDTPKSLPGRLVSAISGKLIIDPNDTRMALTKSTDAASNTVYISTLATLSPYRGHGIADALLRRVLEIAVHEHEVRHATVHVWQESQEAKDWYLQRGFEEVRFEEGYYRRLKPSGAWFLRRTIQPSFLLNGR